MYLNDVFFLPGKDGLKRTTFDSMRDGLASKRETSEIHILPSEHSLILDLGVAHKSAGGRQLTPDELIKRGLSERRLIFGIEKLVIAPHCIVIHPVAGGECSIARKRTMRVINGWVNTTRLFYHDFCIYDSTCTTTQPSEDHLLRRIG